jgi:hypothetical protein
MLYKSPIRQRLFQLLTCQHPLVIVLGALAVLNFALFVTISEVIGGSAGNGFVSSGHYFLADHGRKTEVSEAVFNYSLWHGRSVFVTHALGMIACVLLGRTKRG